jgi:tryptophan synthase alpha subunit
MNPLNKDLTTLMDMQKTAFEPFARLGAASLKHFERTLRHQYAVAGDVLELGLAQLQSAGTTQDPSTFIARQAALATNFVAKQQARSTELIKLATEAQSELTGLVATTSEKFTGARKAA